MNQVLLMKMEVMNRVLLMEMDWGVTTLVLEKNRWIEAAGAITEDLNFVKERLRDEK